MFMHHSLGDVDTQKRVWGLWQFLRKWSAKKEKEEKEKEEDEEEEKEEEGEGETQLLSFICLQIKNRPFFNYLFIFYVHEYTVCT